MGNYENLCMIGGPTFDGRIGILIVRKIQLFEISITDNNGVFNKTKCNDIDSICGEILKYYGFDAKNKIL